MRIREVTPGYFQTFGIPILRGRAFADADRTAQPAVILSESAAQILFPGQDPIGHTVQLPSANEWAEVVGVAREIRNTGPHRRNPHRSSTHCGVGMGAARPPFPTSRSSPSVRKPALPTQWRS